MKTHPSTDVSSTDVSSTDVSRDIFIVTQTFPPHIGGMESVMYALANGLAARGYNMHVFGDKPFDAASENFSFSHTDWFKPWRAWRKKLSLTAALRQQTDPLIICDSWKSVAAVPDIERIGGRLVVLAYGQEYLKTGRHAERVSRALARTHILIANSKDTLERATPFLPSAQVTRHVIAPTFALPADAPPITLTKNDNRAPLKLVSLCRLEARKGLAQTIKALAGMKSELPDFTWQIAGIGPEAENLHATIRACGLEDQVFLSGHLDVEDKVEFLSNADLFIMPSYQHGNSLEGFGISYIEAARFGVPALAGNTGGAREAVLHGETGWCVDTLNPDELAAALREAMTDTERREQLGRQAQERYLAEFTGPDILDRFANLCGLR